VEEARGRVPVIAGIITNSTRAAIERGRAVADLGVAALQITPVHYLYRPDDEAMMRHFAAVAEGSGLPVIIYNVVPWSYLSPALLARILREVDGVIGVKQSASDLKALADLLLLIEQGEMGREVRILSAVDAPNLPANVKAVMRLRGRNGGLPRAPMPPSSCAQVERIRQALSMESRAAG
jgi:4-hydroxy-tetrahydrodipicolinate synthase